MNIENTRTLCAVADNLPSVSFLFNRLCANALAFPSILIHLGRKTIEALNCYQFKVNGIHFSTGYIWMQFDFPEIQHMLDDIDGRENRLKTSSKLGPVFCFTTSAEAWT